MKILRPDIIPESSDPLGEFFRDLASRPERLLLLDFDGTLAPFTVDRHATRPYPGVSERLSRIGDIPSNRLVIISGRSISDLLRLLTLDPLPEMWGSHGWERLLPGASEVDLHAMSDKLREGLSQAEEWCRRERLDEWIERKPSSIALHWRGRAPDELASVSKKVHLAWLPLSKSAGLEVHEFDGGVELRAPGQDKGSVVRSLLSECRPDAGVAFLGDDLTDEDGFRVLEGRGLRVLVRDQFRPTEADLWIRPPEELLGFLDQWAAATPTS